MMYYTRFNTELCEIILVGNESGLKCCELNT
ncbi:MAG TPA: cysteine methyltransferase, partial [Spirochaeta sp.]|nr:cysteine methyltransferase [Spirochaeta sp.]